MGGEMVSDLDAARLRVVLQDALTGSREFGRTDDSSDSDAENSDYGSVEPVALSESTDSIDATGREPHVRSAG